MKKIFLLLSILILSACTQQLLVLVPLNPLNKKTLETWEKRAIEAVKDKKLIIEGFETTYLVRSDYRLEDTRAFTQTYSSTLLHLAVTNDSLKVAKFILEKGYKPDGMLDGEGRPPLAYVKSPEMAKLLIDYGADIHKRYKQKSIMYHLLSPPSDWFIQSPEWRTSERYTPGDSSGFGVPIWYMDKRIASVPEFIFKYIYLFEYSSYARENNTYQLLNVLMSKLRNAIEYLKSKGIDVNVKDFYGNTPLHELARIYGSAIGAAQAYVHIKNDNDVAISLKILQDIFGTTVNFMKQIGIDLNVKNGRGETYLDVFEKTLNKDFQLWAVHLNRPSALAQFTNILNQTAKIIDSGVRIYRGIQDIRGGGSSSSGGGSSSGTSSSPAGTQQGGGGGDCNNMSRSEILQSYLENFEIMRKNCEYSDFRLTGLMKSENKGIANFALWKDFAFGMARYNINNKIGWNENDFKATASNIARYLSGYSQQQGQDLRNYNYSRAFYRCLMLVICYNYNSTSNQGQSSQTVSTSSGSGDSQVSTADQRAHAQRQNAIQEMQRQEELVNKKRTYERFKVDNRIIEGPPFDEQGNYQKGEFVSNAIDIGLSVESDNRKLAIKSDIYKNYYLKNNSGQTIVIHKVFVSNSYNVRNYGSKSNSWYVVHEGPITLKPGEKKVVLKIIPKHYGTDVSEDIRWNFGIEINKVKWSLPK